MVPSQRYHLQGLNRWPQGWNMQGNLLWTLGFLRFSFKGYFEYGRTYMQQQSVVSHGMYEWFQERILLSARIDVTVNYTRKAQRSQTCHLIDQGYLGKLRIFTQLNEDHRSSFLFQEISYSTSIYSALCRCFCCVGSEGAVDLVTSIWKNGMMYCLKFFNLILEAFPIPNYQVQQVRVGEGFETLCLFLSWKSIISLPTQQKWRFQDSNICNLPCHLPCDNPFTAPHSLTFDSIKHQTQPLDPKCDAHRTREATCEDPRTCSKVLGNCEEKSSGFHLQPVVKGWWFISLFTRSYIYMYQKNYVYM